MTSRMLRAVALTAVLAFPRMAGAFGIMTTNDGEVIRWDHSDLTYYLDPVGPTDVTDGSDIDAIEESFDDWQAVSCSALTFQKLGSTSNKDVLPISEEMNDRNELVWVNNSKWPFGQYVLGVTMPVSYGGTIVEADIAFNGYSQEWTTSPDGYRCDVKSVTIHELGHFFGAQHVLYGYDADNPPTMAPYADPYGTMASLEQDDKNAACFLYPANGYYECSSNDDCPYVVGTNSNGEEYYESKVKCSSSGYCTGLAGVSPASVEFGQACTQTADCQGDNTCQILDSGVRMCTTACTMANDTCPDHYHCVVLQSNDKRYCAPGNKTLAEGETCERHLDCKLLWCFEAPNGSGSTCRQQCSDSSTCPVGTTCWVPVGTSQGGCYPTSEMPDGDIADGQGCSYDRECASDWCTDLGQGRVCATSCNPLSPTCPEGSWCSVISGQHGVCTPGEPPTTWLPDGSLCQDGAACASGWCVPQVGTDVSVCRTSCNLVDWACPEGTACISYGSNEFGVCMPAADRKWIGDDCGAPEECVTYMCWAAAGEPQTYCAMSCIAGLCSEGFYCGDGGALGPLCQKTPPSTPVTPEPPGETPAGETPKSDGGGCNASPGAGHFGVTLLLMGLGWVVLQRRRLVRC